ncbi:MAG: hypothetical protein ACI8RD_011671, partial [Bacillariaceae sp.]
VLEGVPLSTYCTGMFDIFFFFLIFFLYEVLRVKQGNTVPLFFTPNMSQFLSPPLNKLYRRFLS